MALTLPPAAPGALAGCPGPGPSGASPLPAWVLAWCAAFLLVTFATYWVLGGPAFADFGTYTDIADQLVDGSTDVRVLGFEGVSRGLLRLFREAFGAADPAVRTMALFCQTLVLFTTVAAARRRDVYPANLLLVVAFFAPLLALITVRATPAYLLCAAAIGYTRTTERPRLAWVAAAAAAGLLFHLSAVFVLAGAVAAGLVPVRLSRRAFVGLAAVAGVFVLALRQSLDLSTVLAMAQGATVLANPLLTERLAYFAEVARPPSLTHLLYFAFVTFVMYRAVLLAPPHPSDRLVLTLFVMYCACLISPVVAFRNSQYLVLPVIATARRPVFGFGDGLLGQTMHVLAGAALLAVSLRGVLQLD